MPESTVSKAIRHIQEGRLDPATLMRGVKHLGQVLEGRHEDEGHFLPPTLRRNFKGVVGLTVADYQLKIPRWGVNSPLVNYGAREIRLYEFPVDSSLQVLVTEGEPAINTQRFAFNVPLAIAEFTGPTFLSPYPNRHSRKDRLPNNGFYLENCPDGVVFGESHERKGAFGLNADRKLVIVDDEEKHDIVSRAFAGHKSLVGCSYYFRGVDSIDVDAPKGLTESHSAYLSYLMQFIDKMGLPRNCFGVSRGLINRATMKKLFDDYVGRMKGQDYIAVELELTGSECTVITLNGPDGFANRGFSTRFDHYVMTRDKEVSKPINVDPAVDLKRGFVLTSY